MKQSPYQLLMGVVPFLEPLLFLILAGEEDWRQRDAVIYSQKMDPESKNRRLL